MALDPNTRDPVGNYRYISDPGFHFLVELTSSVAAAGGFELYDANAPEARGPRPRRLIMRHITLAEARIEVNNVLQPAKYHVIPVADDSLTAYNEGGTVSFGGVDMTVKSRKGESGKLGQRTPPGP